MDIMSTFPLAYGFTCVINSPPSPVQTPTDESFRFYFSFHPYFYSVSVFVASIITPPLSLFFLGSNRSPRFNAPQLSTVNDPGTGISMRKFPNPPLLASSSVIRFVQPSGLAPPHRGARTVSFYISICLRFACRLPYIHWTFHVSISLPRH